VKFFVCVFFQKDFYKLCSGVGFDFVYVFINGHICTCSWFSPKPKTELTKIHSVYNRCGFSIHRN
jgi:hypothetical protein